MDIQKISHRLLALFLAGLLFAFGSASIVLGQNEGETPVSEEPSTSASSGYTLARIVVDGNQYLFRYMVINATVQEMIIDKDTKSLVVWINSGHPKGELQLELTRDIIDAKDLNEDDVVYNVFIDGSRADFTEVDKTEQFRYLTVPFESNATQITITGTHVVPEFFSLTLITIIVVLAIGSTIVLGRMTNLNRG